MIPNSQPSSISAWPSTLPSELVALFTAIQRTLTSQFPTSPPYTIQRLAELVLRPCSHYRTLPSYLRALDRVLSVSSTADAFPLPLIATNGPTENGHGTTYLASGGPSLHSNDFNGAALTRIPWLRDPSSVLINTERPLTGDLRTESTSLIDGPNGAGSLETVTVSVNGMTSATAQRAGLGINSSSDPLHPASDGPSSGRMTRSGTASALARREEEADEERVHARGPDEMTMEDMGPQASDRVGQAFDVEAALGRPGEGEDMVVAEVEGEMRESDAGVDMYSRHRGDNTGAGTEMDEGTGADGQQNLVDTSAL
ncbi:hypothetical protein MMC19_003196 [Ptychographa xylographoides]|nr:hypothetical protein [Ptychographa xylographoides]